MAPLVFAAVLALPASAAAAGPVADVSADLNHDGAVSSADDT
ncbi:MAG TPA: hypothetical protein VH231_15840 [Solirubrobacteraceae bacterium]|nr:hypothetical protein [Solirubrobacteraceae bacterium]